LRHFLVGLSAETNIESSPATCQSGSPPGRWEQKRLVHVPRPIEDDDSLSAVAKSLTRQPLNVGLASEACSKRKSRRRRKDEYDARMGSIHYPVRINWCVEIPIET
jgi:hypothetical protein